MTGLNRWAAVWLNGLVCIFYTSIGGLKAVVWTDTLQIICMIAGFVTICVDGLVEFGFADIWSNAVEENRLDFDWRADPRYRHSIWAIVIGGVLGTWGNLFVGSQSFTQRMLSARNEKDMKKAIYGGFIGILIILLLAAFTGLGWCLRANQKSF